MLDRRGTPEIKQTPDALTATQTFNRTLRRRIVNSLDLLGGVAISMGILKGTSLILCNQFGLPGGSPDIMQYLSQTSGNDVTYAVTTAMFLKPSVVIGKIGRGILQGIRDFGIINPPFPSK